MANEPRGSWTYSKSCEGTSNGFQRCGKDIGTGRFRSELSQTGTVKLLMQVWKWRLKKVHTIGSVVGVGENDIKDSGGRLYVQVEHRNWVPITLEGSCRDNKKTHTEVPVLDEKGASLRLRGDGVRRGRGPRPVP
jgi:hypothetical protein